MYEYSFYHHNTVRGVYPQKMGILGGTFNPPHTGHLLIARAVYHEFALDKLMFLPSGVPPHKLGLNIAHALHRRAMLDLLLKDAPDFFVSDIETQRPGMTYTIDTLAEVSRNFTYELFYIIGTDTLFDLENWRDFAGVSKMTKFICVQRPGDERVQVLDQISELSKKYGAIIFLSTYTGPPISSTDVRNKFLRGQDITGFVPKEVKEYMEANNVFTKFH